MFKSIYKIVTKNLTILILYDITDKFLNEMYVRRSFQECSSKYCSKNFEKDLQN